MLASLEARNYTPWILHYPAAGVGAPHKRDRVFIVGHAVGNSDCGDSRRDGLDYQQGQEGSPARGANVADTEHIGRLGRTGELRSRRRGESENCNQWQPESSVGRVAHELSRRMDGGIGEDRNGQKTESADRFAFREALRAMWRYRESATSPSELRIGELYRALPDVSRETARRAWYVGQRAETDEALRDLWARVCAASQQESQDLLTRMLERDWSEERREAVGWVEPDIPRVATGVPNRAARLRALGNAVVPAQAAPIFFAIAEQKAAEDSDE